MMATALQIILLHILLHNSGCTSCHTVCCTDPKFQNGQLCPLYIHMTTCFCRSISAPGNTMLSYGRDCEKAVVSLWAHSSAIPKNTIQLWNVAKRVEIHHAKAQCHMCKGESWSKKTAAVKNNEVNHIFILRIPIFKFQTVSISSINSSAQVWPPGVSWPKQVDSDFI